MRPASPRDGPARRARIALALAGIAAAQAIAASACDALIGLHDPVETPSASPATDASDEAPLASDAGDGDAQAAGDSPLCVEGLTSCAGKCVSVATDPFNCGFCGHDCRVSACVHGLCAPLVVDAGLPVRGVIGDVGGVYAMQDQQVLYVPAPSSGNPGVTPVPVFLDAGVLRSVANFGGHPVAAVGPGDAVELFVSPYVGQPLAVDAGDPLSLAAWMAGVDVYWASSDPSAASVMYGEPPKGAAQAFAQLSPGDEPCALSANATGLYWASTRGTFFQPGPGAAPIGVTSTASDPAIAATSTGALVSQNGGTFDLLFAVSSGHTTVLVTGAHANAVASDDELFAYYAAEGIFQVPLAGGAPVLLASASVPDDCHVPQLAVAGDSLFWVDRATSRLMYIPIH